eukprot:scaffold134820_cov57-Cyclotella_meneghiniana.AAC.5
MTDTMPNEQHIHHPDHGRQPPTSRPTIPNPINNITNVYVTGRGVGSSNSSAIAATMSRDDISPPEGNNWAKRGHNNTHTPHNNQLGCRWGYMG